jgi:hypothetical protein
MPFHLKITAFFNILLGRMMAYHRLFSGKIGEPGKQLTRRPFIARLSLNPLPSNLYIYFREDKFPDP